jgi:hypothetical protein
MTDDITISEPGAPSTSRFFARISIMMLGVPTLLFLGLASFHVLSTSYSFVFQYGNRGLGMVVSASLALLILSMVRTAQRHYALQKEISKTVENARGLKMAVPAELTALNPISQAFNKHPLTIAAWLPALIIGVLMYATMVTNFSIKRLEHTLQLAQSGAADQLMIEALWTFATLLMANIVVGIVWAKVWRKKLVERRRTVLSLQEKISHLHLSATDET